MFTKKQENIIQNKLGYVYKNKKLLNLAFTHVSYGNINAVQSNERLEFLGDSVLHFATTNYLYKNFDFDEGVLSKIRSFIVSTNNLAEAIDRIQVIDFLKYGTNDKKISSNSIKADLFEAILGSIYLDSGFDNAYKFVVRKLEYSKRAFEDLVENTNDFKTQLQEKIQTNGKNAIKYKLLKKQGPPHNPTFTVQVVFNKKPMGVGIGKNKKEAENIAAQNTLKKL